MSIATMKRVGLTALRKDKRDIMRALQKTGAVELINKKGGELARESDFAALEAVEQKKSAIEAALDLIKRYDKEKKPMLSQKPPITRDELLRLGEREDEAGAIVEQAREIDAELFALRAKRARIINKINALSPYLSFDASLRTLDSHSKVRMFLGVVPEQSAEAVNEAIAKREGVYVETDLRDRENPVYFIVALRKEAGPLYAELKSAGFIRFSIEDNYGTPIEINKNYERDLAEIDAQIADQEARIGDLRDHKNFLKSMQDFYDVEIEREKALYLLSDTAKTFSLEGYLIDGEQQRLERAVAEVTDAYYIEFYDIAPDEDFPVALQNNRLLKPFEAVTEMYSYPDPRGMDATAFLAPFYFIFYGMMVSDAGYGLLLMIISMAVMRYTKCAGMMKRVLGVVFMGGISTIIWGLLYGGVMGFSIPPLMFNPQEEPLSMLLLCLGLGMVHILFGLGVGSYMLFKRGKPWDAVLDKFPWMMILISVPFIALGGALSTVGTVLLVAGAAMILVFAGRKRPGIMKKITGGFSELYNVTSYLSDVLSYARLFGMGLATGVIGMVFNQIAGMLAGSVIGWVFAAAVFCVGHLFNIGINAMGAYIHSCRLMYIEFFNKFYEDGGKPFKPLAVRIKNYRIV